MSDFRTRIDAICASLPGAQFEDAADNAIPSWKIGGKMFACVASQMDGVSVKCPDVDTAAMLIDAGVGTKAPYFHRSWIRLDPDAAPDELAHRILVSYDTVRAGLTKKVQAALASRET